MMTVTGLPSTLPPKSSTAICAAITDPWPVDVAAGPFMSVRTPILTMSSDSWAHAAGDDTVAAASAIPSTVMLLGKSSAPPVTIEHVGSLAWPGAWLGRQVLFLQSQVLFAIIRWAASTQPKDA